jgi:hypothetical protein
MLQQEDSRENVVQVYRTQFRGFDVSLFGTALFEAVCWRVMERFTLGCAINS